MLNVTESARGVLKTALDNLPAEENQCMRIKAEQGGGFGLTLDVEAHGDYIVTHGDSKVLLVDSETAAQLDDAVLDLKDTEEGPQLTLLFKEAKKAE
jgi:Fe-S cluster assembly iron-binding protein IscA